MRLQAYFRRSPPPTPSGCWATRRPRARRRRAPWCGNAGPGGRDPHDGNRDRRTAADTPPQGNPQAAGDGRASPTRTTACRGTASPRRRRRTRGGRRTRRSPARGTPGCAPPDRSPPPASPTRPLLLTTGRQSAAGGVHRGRSGGGPGQRVRLGQQQHDGHHAPPRRATRRPAAGVRRADWRLAARPGPPALAGHAAATSAPATEPANRGKLLRKRKNSLVRTHYSPLATITFMVTI